MITKDMTISQVIKQDSENIRKLMKLGLHCFGCPASQMETLEEAASVHGIKLEVLLEELNT